MNKEQKELFDQLTTLQQEVALNSISGMSDADAYRNSSGKAKTDSAMRASASEILANPNVKAFTDAMKAEAVRNAVMSREEMLERLSSLARVNMSDLIEWQTAQADEETGELSQTLWVIKDSAMSDTLKMASISEVTASKDGIKIKQHSPLTAMKQLADLAGYNAAQKYDHTSSDGSMSPSGKNLDDFYGEN